MNCLLLCLISDHQMVSASNYGHQHLTKVCSHFSIVQLNLLICMNGLRACIQYKEH